MTQSFDPLGDAVRGLALLAPVPTMESVQRVAASYRRARAQWIETFPRSGKGQPQPSKAARQWMTEVWASREWQRFLEARKAFETSDAIDWEYQTFREALLAEMAALTRESKATAISRVTGIYIRYRTEFAWACSKYGRPGQAWRAMKEFFNTPQWKNYQNLRTKLTKSLPKYQERQREAAKRRYTRTTKAYRATPEVRETLNAQRRARYAAKKGQTQRAIEDAQLRETLELTLSDQEDGL